EEVQAVVLRLPRLLARGKQPLLLPASLPPWLQRPRLVRRDLHACFALVLLNRRHGHYSLPNKKAPVPTQGPSLLRGTTLLGVWLLVRAGHPLRPHNGAPRGRLRAAIGRLSATLLPGEFDPRRLPRRRPVGREKEDDGAPLTTWRALWTIRGSTAP